MNEGLGELMCRRHFFIKVSQAYENTSCLHECKAGSNRLLRIAMPLKAACRQQEVNRLYPITRQSMIMMTARMPFVIKSMMVMPMPSQNRINPKSRFTIRRLSFESNDRISFVFYYFIQLGNKCYRFVDFLKCLV